MSGFIQREDNIEFDELHDLLNSFVERENEGERPDAVEAEKLVTELVKFNLYGLALRFFDEYYAPALDAKTADAIRGGMRDKHAAAEAAWRDNLERNLAALDETDPRAADAARAALPGKAEIAGDAESGYRILLFNGADYEDFTPTLEAFEQMEKELPEGVKRISAMDDVLTAGILLVDVFKEIVSEADRARPRNKLVLYIVENDIEMFIAALKVCDLSDWFRSGSFLPFVGEEYRDQIKAWFAENMFALFPLTFAMPGDGRAEIVSAVDREYRARIDEMIALADEVEKYYAGIDAEEWKRAFSGSLRIFFLHDKYNRFHDRAAVEAMEALRSMGHTVESHHPEGAIGHANPYSIMKRLSIFKPHLAININYSRLHNKTTLDPDRLKTIEFGVFPESLPYMWWEIDSDGRAYGDEMGRLPREFVFAAYKKDMLAAGFDDSIVTPLPVPASAEVFNPEKLTEEEQRRFACDVCFVGNLPSLKKLNEGENGELNTALYKPLRYALESGFNSIFTASEYESFTASALDFITADPPKPSPKEYHRAVRMRGVGRLLMRSLPLEWLAAAGVDVRVWGENWDQIGPLADRAGGVLSTREDVCKALKGAKIVLADAGGGTMSRRVVEAALSGAFLLVRRLPPEKDRAPITDFLVPGEDFDWFADKAELLEKVRFYLANSERRAEMAARARAKALESLSMEVQMKRLIEVVRKRIEAEE